MCIPDPTETEKQESELIQALSSSDQSEKDAAIIILSEIGSTQAIAPLANVLANDKNKHFRQNAALALGKIGRRGNTQAVTPLINALNDKDPDVRESAVAAIGRIGETSSIPETINPLIDALDDKDEYVRANAAYALGVTGSPQAVTPLMQALNDPSELVQDDARSALADIAKSQSALKCQWTGTWSTNWGDMVLQQSGNAVSGTYTHDQGKIRGKVSGNRLAGTWSEAPSYSPTKDAGEVKFNISEDCNSIEGNWRYGSKGEWVGGWTGSRQG